MSRFNVACRVCAAISGRVYASLSPDLSSPVIGPTTPVKKGQFFKGYVDGLTRGEVYWYGVGLNGSAPSSALGKFRVPDYSHRVAFSSCSLGAALSAHQAIFSEAPDFFVHMGDLHYDDINENIVQRYHTSFQRALWTSVDRTTFHQVIPTSYIWDDHDYGPDDSEADSISRDAAVEFFRDRIPVDSLALSSPLEAVYRSFTVGRVVYIVTDLRSEADDQTDPDPRTMLGTAQKDWMKSIVSDPANDDKLFVWVCSRTLHILPAFTFGDDWHSFSLERTELFDYFDTHCPGRIMIVCGDSHQGGMDNGTNCNYTTGGSGEGIPIVMASPLSQTPWTADSAVYSDGIYKNNTQYAIIDFTDDGDDITAVCRIMTDRTQSGTMTLTFTPPTSLGFDPGTRPSPKSGTRFRLNVQRPDVYAEIQELELRTSFGGSQAAIHGTSGTASTNSAFPGYGANQAFNDTTTGNGWSTDNGAPTDNWIEFEFSSTTTIREIAIRPDVNNRPTLVNFGVYDGSVFYPLIDFTGWNRFPDVNGQVYKIG
jgi:hypothetical protein